MNDITIKSPVQSPIGTAVNSKLQPQSGSSSFGQMLADSISQVNRHQQAADASINDLVTGKHTDIHQTMIAMEKASVSFEFLMQIRNKVISAYDRIMRMPI
jgi:flagellar hook-basal body complex protein FliE